MTRRYGAAKRTKADKRAALFMLLRNRRTIDTDASTVTSLARCYGVTEPEMHRLLVEEQRRRAGA